MSEALDTLVGELEQVAARLRGEEMPGAEAAEMVERCAELAGRIGAELDRAGREAERDASAEGQEQLL